MTRSLAHRFGVALPALLLPLLLGACASPKPVVVPAAFTGDVRAPSSYGHAHDKMAALPCRVRVGEIRDLRDNTQTMGELMYRPVHQVDPLGWIKSGFQSLGGDHRLTLVDGDADVTFDADLLKAYVRSGPGMGKSSNVVIRLHYSQNNMKTDQLYRGVDTGIDWDAGDDETRGVLNRALNDLLNQVDADIAARCPIRPASSQ